MVYRVSWLAYIQPVILFLIGLGVSLLLSVLMSNIGRYIGSISLIFFAVLSSLAFIWKVWNFRSIKLTISDTDVLYQSGILPWKKIYRKWEARKIYECPPPDQKNFIGWLFDYGTLIIDGQQGSTVEFKIHHLGRVSKATKKINDLANRHHA